MPRNEAAMKALREANDRMHHAMAVELTGDPDRDFIRAMIPHHQGAVEMAKIAMEHCTDPELKRLAEEIIAAQDREIAFMHDWLARHPA